MADGEETEQPKGPFEEKHSDEDILEFVQSQEVVTTKEVADEFDYHLQSARRRLKKLEEDGEIKVKDVAKRYVWWPNIEDA